MNVRMGRMRGPMDGFGVADVVVVVSWGEVCLKGSNAIHADVSGVVEMSRSGGRDVLVKTFHAACHGLVNNIQTMPIEKI
jgi:hypothetical protein